MAEDKCEKCGAVLPDGALICRECRALTEAGRRARGLGAETEDQAWAKSVQAARERQGKAPAVDADAVLRQVVARTGTDDQILRVTRDEIAHDDRRTEYPAFRSGAKSLFTIGSLLSAVFAAAGLMLVVVAVTRAQDGVSAVLSGMAVAMVLGALGMGTFILFKYLADAVPLLADMADNSRRTVLLLRNLEPRQTPPAEEPHA